jgi:hypothetical protein
MDPELLQVLGYIFELIGFLAGIIIAVAVLKRDSEYAGNRMMALAAILIGMYPGGILIYDIIGTDLVIEIFLRVAIISMLFGGLSLFITMQIMVHSSAWLKFKERYVPYTIGLIVFAVWIIITDFITIIHTTGTVNTQTDPLPLMLMVLVIVFFLLLTMFDLYLHGIKKAQGVQKKKMTIFFSGLAICFLAIILTVASNLTSNVDLGAILDVFFFMVLAIGMVVMMLGFVGQKD